MDATIKKTVEYDQFSTVSGNREINEPHLRRLIASIEERNLLAQNPIIVNDKMQVIDGQHRLLAAKALQVPVYYSIIKDADLSEIQMLNANNRAWLTQDYLHSYIVMGKKDYIRLKEFADEYRISIAIAIRILTDEPDNATLLKKFREGKFQIGDYDRAERIASLISVIRRYSPDMAFSHVFCVRALTQLQAKVDPKLFTNALEQYQLVVTRRPSVKDYLRQFENIIASGNNGKQVRLV